MSMQLSCLFFSFIPHQALVKLFPFLCLLNYTFYPLNLNFLTNRVFSAVHRFSNIFSNLAPWKTLENAMLFTPSGLEVQS